MVSLQESNSPDKGNNTMQLNLDNFSNKRKWNHDGSLDQSEGIFRDRFSSSTQPTKPFYEIELQLETPLPLEWQRCLDIQSGKVHFYNTRTQKRTSVDPRQEPADNNNDDNMSLELELNLSCDTRRKKNKQNLMDNSPNKEKKNNFSELKDNIEEEMVAIVCEKCHFLVMLCKSSPSCPNCKFMHSTPNRFTQQSLLSSFLQI